MRYARVVRWAAWILLTGGLVFGAAGCFSKACTLVGCADQFSVELARADGTFPAGAHQVEVVADGVPVTCTFTFPLAVLPSGGTASPTCAPGLNVTVFPTTSCTEVRNGSSVSLRCDPIDGQWTEHIDVMGTPSEVQIRQTLDDQLLLDRTAMPVYQATRPNGPDCEPVCRQASETWPLP